MDSPLKVREIRDVAPDAVPFQKLLDAAEPVVLKGIARDWPLVQAGLQSDAGVVAMLKSFDAGRPVTAYRGGPEMKGRYFYNDDLTGPNYEAGSVPFGDFLDMILDHAGKPGSPHLYIGSTDVDQFLPGLRAQNDLVLNDPMFERSAMLVSAWIGNRTIAAAHYDMSNNMACNLVGRRRFTLFPPEQVHNLYPGPLEPTPGGQVVSMVDFDDPDFDRFPRFQRAMDAARVAELEPGDMLFFPALWWHQVEALDDFNMMMNYWWNDVPAFVDNPMDTLLHGLLSLRDRPDAEKQGWRELFDYYVFGPAGRASDHIPDAARGALSPLDDMTARRLRAQILRRLNR